MPDIFDIITYDNNITTGTDIPTDDPDWTEVNHYTSRSLAAGRYKISIGVIWKLATVNKSGMIRYSFDGGTNWKTFQSEPKDKTNDNANDFSMTVENNPDGPFDVRVDMTKEAGTASMDCSYCEIIIERKG